MSDLQNAHQSTYDNALSALRDTKSRSAVVHMWERTTQLYSGLDEQSLNDRKEEISSFLDGLAGKEGAVYNDAGWYVEPFGKGLKDGSCFRRQHITPDGLKAIACTALSPNKPQTLFDYRSPTGILLVDSDPVYVSSSDAYSLYYDTVEHLPSEAEWKTLYKAHKSHRNAQNLTPEEMAGKVMICQKPERGKSKELMTLQGHQDPGDKPLLIDPDDADVIAKAKKAYGTMIEGIEDGSIKAGMAEVVSNASLKNAAGIVIYSHEESKPLPANEDGSINWAKALGNRDIALAVYNGLREHKMLAERMREEGIGTVPTMFLYQKGGAKRLVHVPPTKELEILVEGAFKQHNIAIPESISSGKSH